MRHTFLDTTARAIVQRGHAEDAAYVFPNRRAGVFFRRAMKEAGGPEAACVRTLDEVVSGVAGMRPSGRAAAVAMLYRIWGGLVPAGEDRGPDDFFPWGDTLLSDIEDICRAGVDLAEAETDLEAFLLNDGSAAAERLRRSLGGAASRRLEELWKTLPALQSRLLEEGRATGEAPAGVIQLAALRAVRERPAFSPLCGGRRMTFIGLGALSECEKAVLDRLRDEGVAEFVWDYAGKAVTDPAGGAAAFMEENIARYPQSLPACPAAEMEGQDWRFIHVPSATAQAAVAAEEVREALSQGVPEDGIAVVLADASLLGPVLEALPAEAEKVNVTMGCPLSGSAAATLADRLADLQRTARHEGGKTTLHHSEAVAVLMHPYVRAAAGEAAERAAEDIRRRGRRHVDAAEAAGGNAVLEAVLTPPQGDGTARWLMDAFEAVEGAAADLDREYLSLYHALAAELEAALPRGLAPATWMRLLRRAAAAAKVPFEGEPLQGLQVMGPLETRCLDFEKVIYVSANEGALPEGGAAATLLPQGLRAVLGLPPQGRREGVAAYHFWRSCCRAGGVTLIHDSRADGMQGGEETRYAKQLRHLYGVTPREESAAAAIDPAALMAEPLSVAKDEAVMKVLEDRFVHGTGAFSATSLNTYLDCRLRWWWEHALGVRRDDGIADTPDAARMGTIYHSVMENMYRPLTGRTLTAQDIRALRSGGRAAELAREAFAENGMDGDGGGTAILRAVVERLADRTLEADEAAAPLTVLGTETPMQLAVTLPRSGRRVRLFGKIDRLDRPADSPAPRVVDYKSGTVKGRDDVRSAARTLDRSLGQKRPRIGLQLMLYALLAEGRYGTRHDPCVYATRELFEAPPKAAEVDPGELRAFREGLLEMLEEIFDPAVALDAAPDDDKCTNCPFKNICNVQ